MIYLDDSSDNTLYSIIESIYLGEKLSDRLGNSKILVCPGNTKYIVGKTVVINHQGYPKECIETLLTNGCKIISRVDLGIPGVDFQPYILRPDFKVMWNGISLDVSGYTKVDDILDFLEDKIIYLESELYFPKLLGLCDSLIKDDSGNLTALGWLMHQVGLNTVDSCFCDLDLIKTKKLLF